MGVGVRYPEVSTAWRTFSLRPSLLNVMLFPKTGCDRTGTVWIAALWADLRLGLEHQSGFAGVTARTNMAAETLGAPDRAVLNRTAERRGQRFRRCPTPYRLFRFNAMNFSTQLSSGLRLRWKYKINDSACAELPRLVPELNSMHACRLPRCQLVASLRFGPAGGANSFMTPKIVPRVAR